MSLREEIIRLAHEKPELREHLLPLVKKEAWVQLETSVEELKGFLKSLNLNYKFEGERKRHTIKEVSFVPSPRKPLFFITTKEDISIDTEWAEDLWWESTKYPLERIIKNQLDNSKFGSRLFTVYVEDDGRIKIGFKNPKSVKLNKSASNEKGKILRTLQQAANALDTAELQLDHISQHISDEDYDSYYRGGLLDSKITMALTELKASTHRLMSDIKRSK